MKLKYVLASAAASAAILLVPSAASANAITVTSTADVTANDGVCTLREAIVAANTNTASGAAAGECAAGAAGLDTIVFAISGAGVQTIAPVSALPLISEAVFINGYSQLGSSPNTNALSGGINAVLLIELNETGAVGGLVINAAGTTVRGLILNRGTGADKITVNASNVTIAGNFIGTNPAGTVVLPGSSGGFAIRQLQGSNNLIGGPAAADRNLLSGDLQGPIIVENGDNTQIVGNYIGTDVTGTLPLNTGSSQLGVRILGGVPFVTTNTTISGNLISGNAGGGAFITSPGGGFIQGNLIGTQRDGVSPLGNANFGGLDLGSTGFTVGGTALGQANTIAFNTGTGVGVRLNVSGNSILGNSIYSNSLLGISLIAGSATPFANDACDVDTIPGNRGQNYPVITSAPIAAGSVTISGTLNSIASATYRVEFFSSAAGDASGNGEGQTFLGFVNVTTDVACNAGFVSPALAIPPGQTFITATATDPSNNTSEFSAWLPGAPGPTPTPTATPTGTPVATPTPTTVPTATPTPVPGGPPGVNSIPTLSEGMLAGLALALVVAALGLLKRAA
jgi:CSLREA domain-containing protein